MAVSLNSKDFNCSQCSEFEQKDKGCTEDAPIPRRWQIGEEIYRQCPVNLVTSQTWFAIQLYHQYKSGFLPVSGGILDQSSIFLQITNVIQAEIENDNDR